MTNGELLIQTIESVMGIEFDRSFDWKYMKKGDVLIAFDGSWWRKEREDDELKTERE